MTKKFTVFGIAILLFVLYLSYEYLHILRTYYRDDQAAFTPSTNDGKQHQQQQQQRNNNENDIFRFKFTPPIAAEETNEEKSRDLMDEQFLNLFKLDILETLSHTVKESNAIMPFMPNNSAREELGQATWRLLHVMATRFPKQPSPSEQAAFELFVVLLSKLYPCGNCASHFQAILSKKPPSFPSRDAAVQWMCETHNIVNARLNKRIFDCQQAGDAWKCGCADSEEYFIGVPASKTPMETIISTTIAPQKSTQ